MDNRIRKAAIKFNKSLRGKIESKKIIAALKKNGYEVIFYNTDEGDTAVQSYGLQSLAKSKPAFTYSANTKIVFIDNELSATDKRNALLHEAGHIMLGHVGNGTTHLLDSRMSEAEADAFMLEVLHPTRTYYLPLLAVVIVLACFTFNSHTVSDEQAVVPFNRAEEDIVYITSTGAKYHTEGCIHTKDKDCAQIIRTQADKILLPCAICNP